MTKVKSNKNISQKNNESIKRNQELASRKSLFVWVSIISIVLLGVKIYANSFDCSFQLDDKNNIIHNEAIHGLFNLKQMWELNHSRFLAFFSFALNYHFGELNVEGYHKVNLMIHLSNACLVFWITRLLFATPFLKNCVIAKQVNVISLITALLFVSHPLATGAVTYIVQRMASMVAMFYFLSVAMYIKARISESKAKYLFFAGALISAIMAIHTKENAYTLPFVIILIELFFINTKKITIDFKDKRVIVAIIGLIVFFAFVFSNFTLSVLKPLPPSTFNSYTITPSNYFFTQISVIVKYIQLLFVPINQNVDYDFHLSNSLFELPTLINGLILLTLLALSVYLYNRNRIISFGILWFFLTLSIESSFIPITDLIFEHRTYLPSFGFFIILTTGIFSIIREKYKYILFVFFAILIGVNSVLAYQRNNVWKDEISLWSDAVLKSPNKERPYLNRGYAYGNKAQWDSAIADFSKVNELRPKYHAAAYYNLGIAYWTTGQKEKSLENYNSALEINPQYAEAYYSRGICYYYMNNYDSALLDYSKAIEIVPSFDKAYFNRGIIYANRKEWENALSDYSKSIEIKNDNANVYYNRGIVYGNLNQWANAADDFSKVIELDPQNKSAVQNRDFANSRLKNTNTIPSGK
jgi:tetratricopeptide (TPR) repeat protein